MSLTLRVWPHTNAHYAGSPGTTPGDRSGTRGVKFAPGNLLPSPISSSGSVLVVVVKWFWLYGCGSGVVLYLWLWLGLFLAVVVLWLYCGPGLVLWFSGSVSVVCGWLCLSFCGCILWLWFCLYGSASGWLWLCGCGSELLWFCVFWFCGCGYVVLVI